MDLMQPKPPTGPRHPGLDLYEAGVNIYETGDYDAAIKSFQAALTRLPTLVPGWVNLGNCYEKKCEYMRAIAHYEMAISLEPLLGEAYNNLAACYQKMDLIASAKAATEIATSLMPDDSRVRWNRSVFNLTLGLLAKGWDDYDYRFWKPGAVSKKRMAPPSYWQGEPLHGKVILVYTEQGLGEIILYAGMIQECVKDAKHVVIETSNKMVPVFREAFPEATVLEYGATSDVALQTAIDYQIPSGSLGRFCRRAFKDFPRHLGYLLPNLSIRQQVRKNLLTVANGRPIVGISWTSKNEQIGSGKSSALIDWMPLLTKDYCWVSLQYGDCAEELQQIRDLGVDLHEIENCGVNMTEFFATVDACDLVITVSNTTAHAAGAINVPCWVMLPRGESRLWHYFVVRPDSPWYPSLRLFRQQSLPNPRGKWVTEVIAQVERALP